MKKAVGHLMQFAFMMPKELDKRRAFQYSLPSRCLSKKEAGLLMQFAFTSMQPSILTEECAVLNSY